MKNTLVVNLIAPPGAGKSTMAAGIFQELKWKGIDCELVSEFAKELVWEQRNETFKDEIYIFAKQNHRLFRVNGKVDVIITDRPIILSLLYNQKYNCNSSDFDSFNKLILDIHHKYNNLNLFINRKKKYNPNGRNQSEQESDQMGIELKQLLNKNEINYIETNGNKESINTIVYTILSKLKS